MEIKLRQMIERKPYISQILCIGTKVEHPGLIERSHHDLETVWPRREGNRKEKEKLIDHLNPKACRESLVSKNVGHENMI